MPATASKGLLRSRQRLGKYRVEKRIAEGGFASVYRAYDTIEGVNVALKVPHSQMLDDETMEDFHREVRLAARLDHPNILPLKNADYIDGRFVIAMALGEQSLGDRLRSRMAYRTRLYLAEQMLEAVAYAHAQRIIHCDLKPDNFILFPDNWLRLTDFGISKIAFRTVRASGSGTVGYIAPEQAMGRPSFASDVFSMGLILYRMFSGTLPEWPYDWPMEGYKRLRETTHPALMKIIRKAIALRPGDRFADGEEMLDAFWHVKSRAKRYSERNSERSRRGGSTADTRRRRKTVRTGG